MNMQKIPDDETSLEYLANGYKNPVVHKNGVKYGVGWEPPKIINLEKHHVWLSTGRRCKWNKVVNMLPHTHSVPSLFLHSENHHVSWKGWIII